MVSGVLISLFTSAWHNISAVSLYGDNGILTVDTHNSIIALWSIDDVNTHIDWETMTVNDSVGLVATIPVDQCITAVKLNSEEVILNADGYVMRGRFSHANRMFAWQKTWLEWMKNPLKSTAFVDLFTTSVPIIMKNTVLSTVDTWTSAIFSNVSDIKIHDNKSVVRRLLSDIDVKTKFNETVDHHLTYLYNQDLFEDRERCILLLEYVKSLDIDLDPLFTTLAEPHTESDYVFWIEGVAICSDAPRRSVILNTWENFKEDGDNVLVAELLLAVQDRITNWKPYISHENVFKFISPANIQKTCDLGLETEWIQLFQNSNLLEVLRIIYHMMVVILT